VGSVVAVGVAVAVGVGVGRSPTRFHHNRIRASAECSLYSTVT
jgi:hypothetical protein